MHRIIWRDPSTGMMSIHTPSYNDSTRFELDEDQVRVKKTTDADFLIQERAKVVPDGILSWLIDDEDPHVAAFLGDRSHRNNWNHIDGVLFVDLGG